MGQTHLGPEIAPTTDGVAALPNGAVHPRQRHGPPRPLILIALLVIAATAYLLLRPAATGGALIASGTVEADELTVAAEVGGRLAELHVDEGAVVVAGQVLGQVDDQLIQVQLRQAGPAERQILEVQLERTRLRAPIAGVVQKRLVRRGEVVAPGTPVLTLADPADLRLNLYILERDLGRVRVDQGVQLRADPYPGRLFEGRVQSISTRAEFTPRNVQTQKDRQNLVFAVRVRVPNPDRALKAGLPVDATFEE